MVRKVNDLSKHARQEIVLLILQTYATGEGLSTKEIQNICEQKITINFRTLSRDLDELSRDFPITEKIVSGKRIWIFLQDNEYMNKMSLIRLRYIKEILTLLANPKDVAC
jgi:hypothetical protein